VKPLDLTVREHARNRGKLDGADAQALELSESVLRQLWKGVFLGCAFNGWFLLTLQMHSH
jgi:hypothetical protein